MIGGSPGLPNHLERLVVSFSAGRDRSRESRTLCSETVDLLNPQVLRLIPLLEIGHPSLKRLLPPCKHRKLPVSRLRLRLRHTEMSDPCDRGFIPDSSVPIRNRPCNRVVDPDHQSLVPLAVFAEGATSNSLRHCPACRVTCFAGNIDPMDAIAIRQFLDKRRLYRSAVRSIWPGRPRRPDRRAGYLYGAQWSLRSSKRSEKHRGCNHRYQTILTRSHGPSHLCKLETHQVSTQLNP